MIKNLTLVLFLLCTVSTVFAQIKEEISAKETPTTTIEFQETRFEWGDINEGEIIQNVFTFTNTGDEPFIITNAKGSCGCTVPRYPKEPIMPGETADLLVQFDSKNKGKVEGSKQAKRVTLTGNTDPKNSFLTISGTVYKLENEDEVKAIFDSRSKSFDIDASSISIFPNPTAQDLNVNFTEFIGEKATISIYNNEGKLIELMNIERLTSEGARFDVSNYDSGVYTASIKIKDKNRIAKQFIVQ